MKQKKTAEVVIGTGHTHTRTRPLRLAGWLAGDEEEQTDCERQPSSTHDAGRLGLADDTDRRRGGGQ